MYQLYRAEEKMPSQHDTYTLRKWTKAVSEETGVQLHATLSMMHNIWKHTSHVVSAVQKLKHGCQQQEFLQKGWNYQLKPDDIQRQKDIALSERMNDVFKENSELKHKCNESEKEISVLKKANHSLEEKVNRLSDQLRKSKAAGYHPTRGRSSIKSAAECTKRHQRNLKRRRANSCSDSLSWLGQEGYTPTHVIVQNTATGAVEQIVLDHAEVDDP